MKYELIIIDSGSVGAAADYYAIHVRLKVLMTDSYIPLHQQVSHYNDTRLIRQAYGEGEKYVPLVLHAQALWDKLSAHNEEPILSTPASLTSLQPITFFSQRHAKRATVAIERRVPRCDCSNTRWPKIRVPEIISGCPKLTPVSCATN